MSLDVPLALLERAQHGEVDDGDVLLFLARKSEGEWAGLYTRRSAAEPGWGVG